MMHVLSLKLLHTLHAERERERSESIETDDDAAALMIMLFEPCRSMSTLHTVAQDTNAIQNCCSLKSNEYRRRK
jgi:hypothetical protein